MPSTPAVGPGTRFDVLDAWRGLGSLLVLYTHLSLEWRLPEVPIVRSSFLFVDFFFVLSGFVISHAYGGRLEGMGAFIAFMARRIGRLWPLHLTMLMLFALVIGAKLILSPDTAMVITDTRFSAAALLSGVVMTNGMGLHDFTTWNRPTWSISTEFWTYVVFGLVFLCRGPWRRGLILAVGLAGVGGLALFTPQSMNVTYDYGFFRTIYGFAAGCVAYGIWCRVPFRGGFATATALEAVTAVLMVAALCLPRQGAIHMAVPLLFIAMMWVYAPETGALSRVLRTPALLNLGHWSYGTYLIHDLVIYLMNMAAGAAYRAGATGWRHIAEAPGPIQLTLVLAFTAVVTGLSALSYRVIEKPGMRFFARLGRRRAVRTADAYT